mgnify:CR=1 FL=1
MAQTSSSVDSTVELVFNDRKPKSLPILFNQNNDVVDAEIVSETKFAEKDVFSERLGKAQKKSGVGGFFKDLFSEIASETGFYNKDKKAENPEKSFAESGGILGLFKEIVSETGKELVSPFVNEKSSAEIMLDNIKEVST